MTRLDGKVALVTGATGGIGRAAVEAFARAGARVVATARGEDGAEDVLRLARDAGSDALLVPADLTARGDVEALVERAAAHFGRLDCAFNNAAVEGSYAPLLDQPEDEFDKVVAANLRSVWLCLRAELARMLGQGGDGYAIVNTASMGGLVGFPNMAVYVAAKHGVVGLTRAAALDYARRGVRVNTVRPGVIDAGQTDRMTRDNGQSKDEVAEQNPSGRLGRPGEVADAVVWLCSDRASFVNGHALSVDGGYVAR